MNPKQYQRDARIDIIRLLAAFAVVCIHTEPFYQVENSTARFFGEIILHTSRFAVPFFFITSGYFFGIKLRNTDNQGNYYKKYIKRLAIAFVGWSIIYLFVSGELYEFEKYQYGLLRITYWHFLNQIVFIVKSPIDFLLRGTSAPLWFLVSLGIAISILFAAVITKNENKILYVGIVLYLVGLILGSYSNIFGLNFGLKAQHKGPFEGLLFVSMGFIISRQPIQFPLFKILFIILFGYFLQLGEVFYLWKYYEVPSGTHEFLIGTIFLGLGVFLLALSLNNLLDKRYFSKFAIYTLGIYASHLLIAKNISFLKKFLVWPLWETFYPIATFILALSLSYLLSKNKYAKSIVT